MNERYLIIIQARMSSSRFPGKSMYLFKGKPALGHLFDSIAQFVDKEQIRIATTKNVEDDEICDFCLTNGVSFFRGDEANVASRFFQIVCNTNIDYFARLNADSPLFDWRLLKEAVEKYRPETDILSSTVNKTVPSGMNVEMVNAKIYCEEYNRFCHADHFEHVTKYFYDNSSRFKISSLECVLPERYLAYKFSFDTTEDRDRLEVLFQAMGKEHYHLSLNDKCRLYERLGLQDRG